MVSLNSVYFGAGVRVIEFARRVTASPDSLSANYSRHIGRVGALAVALGVGAAIASMPIASADSSGSGGASASDAGATKAPGRHDSVRGAAVSRSGHRGLDTAGAGIAAGASPVSTKPAAVAARAVSVARRGGAAGDAARAAVTAATTASSAGAGPLPSGAAVASPAAAAVGAWQPGSVLRIFIGSGTADNPNAGILLGDGYTYTSYEGACLNGACHGGNSGMIGNGGDGFAGGDGRWGGRGPR